MNREFEDQYNPVIKETVSKADEKTIELLNLLLADYSDHDELKSKAINIKKDFMGKGLDEKLAYDIIKNKLDALK